MDALPPCLADTPPEAISALCRRFHVRRLDIFGSATNGRFDPARSDLDFLVTFEDVPPRMYADCFFGLREGLIDLFGREVDLLTEPSVRNPYLRTSIEAGRRVLFTSES